MARTLTVICISAATLLAPAVAQAASSTLTIRGRGFGHGVGMSQYGAYGYALHGVGYAEILGHYYTGTALQPLAANRSIRVLLRAGRSSVKVTEAGRAGDLKLNPKATYTVRSNGLSGTTVTGADGRRVGTSSGPLDVRGVGDAPVKIRGSAGFGVVNGRWRGTVEVRPGTVGGLDVINDLPVEQYVAGVVAGEMPSSWPADALKAQAVAARTYALTTRAGGSAFDQYADTRSQVYKGVAGETSATNSAVRATAGEVVTYQGKPAITYFFSTSGGETENVENGFPGAAPQPWLKAVDDPYDDLSPKHTWGPIKVSLSRATFKLRGLVRGRLKSIKVLKRGASPRIVKARLVGTRGNTTVTGATLRARFGLNDSWASFSLRGASKKAASKPKPRPKPSTTGGASPSR